MAVVAPATAIPGAVGVDRDVDSRVEWKLSKASLPPKHGFAKRMKPTKEEEEPWKVRRDHPLKPMLRSTRILCLDIVFCMFSSERQN
jgi:hypothetical protein